MKIRFEIECDTETGSYQLSFFNAKAPQEHVPPGLAMKILKKVVDVTSRVQQQKQEALQSLNKISSPALWQKPAAKTYLN
jgi:hypothetical protein